MKRQNPVAKNLRQFNKAVTFNDRKKALKRGYQKHKSRPAGFVVYGQVIILPTVFSTPFRIFDFSPNLRQ